MKKSTTVSMDVLRPNAAGIDIGATSSYVALPPSLKQPVREFGVFTCDLHELTAWLKEHKVSTVAMESTGIYWVPMFQVLEAAGIEVFLVNAKHVKAVPGRKSDVRDCQWLQHLHSVGLLNGSFRPEQEIVAIRSLARHRDSLVRSFTRHILRIQKSLNQMNLPLHNVISDISGVTGLAIIDAILGGERDPEKLAKLRDRRIKASAETIRKSLEGDYRSEHIFTLRQERQSLAFVEKQIQECELEIERAVLEFNRTNSRFHGEVSPSSKSTRINSQKKLRLRDGRDHFIHSEMKRTYGIDLFEIPGFATDTVLTVFSEVGSDFSKFRSEAAFASWLALCPDNEITGNKVHRTKTRRTKSRLAAALRQAAFALANAKSYYGEIYRRLRAKFGAPKAVTAMANRLARLLYHLVTTGQEFDESKFGVASDKQERRQLAALTRKARSLGFSLIPN